MKGTVLTSNPQARENDTTASLSAEHDRLIELLEHLREVVLVESDPPAIRSALDELEEYGRWEFGLEEAAFDHRRPEDGAMHHQEHVVLLEKLRDLRHSVDDGLERLEDRDRTDLYEYLSDWLVHALSEQTQPPTTKAH
jgi:hemerythrin-like metal-binding protein